MLIRRQEGNVHNLFRRCGRPEASGLLVRIMAPLFSVLEALAMVSLVVRHRRPEIFTL